MSHTLDSNILDQDKMDLEYSSPSEFTALNLLKKRVVTLLREPSSQDYVSNPSFHKMVIAFNMLYDSIEQESPFKQTIAKYQKLKQSIQKASEDIKETAKTKHA